MNKPGWMFLADTLIRAYLHTDPTVMSDEEWAVQVDLAKWTEARMFKGVNNTR